MNTKKIYRIQFEQVDSTHFWAKNHLNEFQKEGITCVTAKTQTNGQGRFHRNWYSSKGNLFLTLFFTLPKENKMFHHVGQVLCLSVAKVLKEEGFAPSIKWPNDLLLCERKVAGVLTEIISLGSKFAVLTSVGVNVNLSETELVMINQPATSLSIISEKNWDVEEIIGKLIEEFCSNLFVLIQKGFSPFYPTYNSMLAWRDKEVICRDGENTIIGICKGITKEGALQILLPDQSLFMVLAGDLEKSLSNAS